jgi:enamine deaminase RidA (YjgF/YER057c/UK114 family)
MPREVHKGTWEEKRGFSPAVVTQGGKVVWLAGVGMAMDEDGNSLAGDFEAQAHASFREIERILARAGGKLTDIVTMTVFTLDVRYGEEIIPRIRRQYFPDAFPAAALITVSGFARPDMMIEIQAIAVVGDE